MAKYALFLLSLNSTLSVRFIKTKTPNNQRFIRSFSYPKQDSNLHILANTSP